MFGTCLPKISPSCLTVIAECIDTVVKIVKKHYASIFYFYRFPLMVSFPICIHFVKFVNSINTFSIYLFDSTLYAINVFPAKHIRIAYAYLCFKFHSPRHIRPSACNQRTSYVVIAWFVLNGVSSRPKIEQVQRV